MAPIVIRVKDEEEKHVEFNLGRYIKVRISVNPEVEYAVRPFDGRVTADRLIEHLEVVLREAAVQGMNELVLDSARHLDEFRDMRLEIAENARAQVMRRLGVKRGAPRKIDWFKIAVIARYAQAGLNEKTIAEKCGISEKTVRRKLKEYDLTFPQFKEKLNGNRKTDKKKI